MIIVFGTYAQRIRALCWEGLIAEALTGIRGSNIAKFMNKVVSPSLHKTRVTGSGPFGLVGFFLLL
jgi:hypothetical protein